MRVSYDKICLTFSLVVLLVSCLFYLLHNDSADAGLLASIRDEVGQADYLPIPSEDIQQVDALWSAPKPQDKEGFELFDTFTPPKIYWDQLGQQLVFEPLVPPPPLKPFGVELLAIKHKPYHVQLEAFFLPIDAPVGQSIVQFYDSDRGLALRGRSGEHFPESGFALVGFRIDKIVNESKYSKTISKASIATIQDINTGKIIDLNINEIQYEENTYIILMRTTQLIQPIEFVWQELGDSFDNGGVRYQLLGFDEQQQSVLVEKRLEGSLEPEEQQLQAMGEGRL